MSETVSVGECEIVKETRKSYLVNLIDLEIEEQWIPKSVIDEDKTGDLEVGETCEELYIEEWFLRKELS